MTLLFCVVVGLVLGGIYLAVYTVFDAGLHKTRNERMVNRSLPLMALLQSPQGAVAAENFDLYRQFFRVYDQQERILFKSRSDIQIKLPPIRPKSKVQPTFDIVQSTAGSFRRAVIPFRIQGQSCWFVLLEANSEVDAIEAAFRMQFLIIWISSIVLLAFLARWYVSRSLLPILLLTQQAEELTGKLSPGRPYEATPRLKVSNPHDEVGRLATNFNVLFDRLDTVVLQLRRFVSDAAHELRTPLAVLRGEAQLLLSQPHTSNEYKNGLLTLDAELATMNRIIEGLFTLSMADAGQLALEQAPVHLEEVIEEACGLVALQARDKQIQIHVPVMVEQIVTGDQTMLRQLFLILLHNAVKYSPSRTSIFVELKRLPTQVIVTIRDEGRGIAAEHLPHIFRRFYRAAEQTGEGTRSGGLGLAIASAIVSAHGGSILCESTLGCGSTFTVTLNMTATPRSRSNLS